MRAPVIAPNLQVELFEIGSQMKQAHLPAAFISDAVLTAIEFEGVYDLMKMWTSETDETDRNEIVADIQDMIDDCTQNEKLDGPYVKFNDLDGIRKNIRAFKDGLLQIVLQQGGLKKLSELTKIPQPSLSRFFSSTSMPRRSTLMKVAKALRLDAIQLATEWSR
ncbi:helix-turn-helix transcriptional regulator [Bdellovibrionota bacterium FG-2]